MGQELFFFFFFFARAVSSLWTLLGAGLRFGLQDSPALEDIPSAVWSGQSWTGALHLLPLLPISLSRQPHPWHRPTQSKDQRGRAGGSTFIILGVERDVYSSPSEAVPLRQHPLHFQRCCCHLAGENVFPFDPFVLWDQNKAGEGTRPRII